MYSAERLFKAQADASNLEEEFGRVACQFIGVDYDATEWPFEDYHFDSYDASFEFDRCLPDFTLTPEQCAKFWEIGFWRCWLNYNDGTERYYHRSGI